MASIGSLINGHWKRIERDIELALLRFANRQRRKRKAARDSSTTNNLWTSYYISYSLLCHHYFLALVSFTALLSEVLIIVLAGVPYSSTQLYVAFLVLHILLT